MVKPPIKAAPSDIAFELAGVGPEGDPLKGGGGLGQASDIEFDDDRRARDMGGMMGQNIGGGVMGYKKGGKVKATGGYKVVGQRKGYKVGE